MSRPFTIGSQPIFRIRFTFSSNGVIYSRIALICSSSPLKAKESLCKWILTTFGPLPDFKIRTIVRFTDCSYLIPDDLELSFCDSPSDCSFIVRDGNNTVRLSKSEVISQLGEFVEANEILNLFND